MGIEIDITTRLRSARKQAGLAMDPTVAIREDHQRWLELSVPLAEDAPGFQEICGLNSRCTGVEFRDDDGALSLHAFHLVSEHSSVDDDELLFLCVQLREALDTYAEVRGIDAAEVLLGE